MNSERKIISVQVIFPFWLRWAKRFVTINFNRHNLRPGKLKGQQIQSIIIDEIDFVEYKDEM